MEDYGAEVQRDENNQYHLLDREFELPEIKLLFDSIQASKFLSEAKTRELIKKLEKQCSHYQAGTLHREVIIANRVKTMNNSVHYQGVMLTLLMPYYRINTQPLPGGFDNFLFPNGLESVPKRRDPAGKSIYDPSL